MCLPTQVKEIIYPLGATIDVREIKLGDETMSVLEIWGAEYQENDALLIKPDARPLLEAICVRERCLLQVQSLPNFREKGATISESGETILRHPRLLDGNFDGRTRKLALCAA